MTGNYVFETGSMTGILGQLKWESLKKRRKGSRLILLYKGLKGKARIPTDDLIPKNRRCRNQHSLAFQIPSASKEAYKSSLFPQTIRDWNDLPDSLVSSAEMSDDCVSVRFTRAFKGLISPPSEPPGEIMSFGVSPVNYSDSDAVPAKNARKGVGRRGRRGRRGYGERGGVDRRYPIPASLPLCSHIPPNETDPPWRN